MATALTDDPTQNLLFAPFFVELLKAHHTALRQVVGQSAVHGHPVPALGSRLAYFETIRTGRGTANMIQGQRDYFGAHRFERTDGDPGKHGPWEG